MLGDGLTCSWRDLTSTVRPLCLFEMIFLIIHIPLQHNSLRKMLNLISKLLGSSPAMVSRSLGLILRIKKFTKFMIKDTVRPVLQSWRARTLRLRWGDHRERHLWLASWVLSDWGEPGSTHRWWLPEWTRSWFWCCNAVGTLLRSIWLCIRRSGELPSEGQAKKPLSLRYIPVNKI